MLRCTIYGLTEAWRFPRTLGPMSCKSLVCWVACLLASTAACGSESVCRVAADCMGGVCGTDGVCLSAGDAAPGLPDGQASDAAVVCNPNSDGSVDRSEYPARAGLSATYRVATDATVSTMGIGAGVDRAWDFSSALASDTDIEVVLRNPSAEWFGGVFPAATYTTQLSAESDLLGVFQVTSDALLLLGVVSPIAGVFRTELEYDPPVRVIRFPLQNSATWSDTSTVSGLASGVVSVYTEDYQTTVDAVGEVTTPFGVFPTLRVRVELQRTVGLATVTKRSFLFVSECFGSVATITSEDYESEVEFTDAAEVRRLSL